MLGVGWVEFSSSNTLEVTQIPATMEVLQARASLYKYINYKHMHIQYTCTFSTCVLRVTSVVAVWAYEFIVLCIYFNTATLTFVNTS